MIHGTDGKKLSKRRNAVAVGDYAAMGILPEAMVNFLALLGWSPGGDLEVMTRDEMVERFSPDGLLKKASVFDPQKLEWMNGQHLVLLPLERLKSRATPALEAAGLATAAELDARPAWYDKLLEQLRVRSRTVDDIVRQAVPYLREEIEYDEDAVAKQWLKDPATAARLLADCREVLATLDAWEPGAMETALRSVPERHGVGAGKVFQPLRVALVGQTASPGMFDVLELLGRDRALRRIDASLARIAAARGSDAGGARGAAGV
jgi:glutamyl-tRNA synthetase